MTPEQFQQAAAIFLEARGLDAAAREAMLDRRCAGDGTLRAAVAAWLREDSRAGPVDRGVDVRAFVAGLESAAAERPQRIGRYRIVRLIDEGGMGAVYEAQQDDPPRPVALKVIRPGLMTPSLTRRFQREAHLLGRLKHPGIAQIYEAGTTDGGQPFFAMELVRGRGLLEYAAGRKLTAPQRLALLAAVADALHHAHAAGVVHRDLKPANILVEEATGGHGRDGDGDPAAIGQPKILDFGVARATDADVAAVTLQTDAGLIIGTVPYMSPEQAGGDPSAVDARSDVYSLGVIAFELLAGRLPYEVHGRMIHEAVRVIREQEPTHLSRFDRRLRGDVETIVAKALEKDAARRYQSAAEMAADLRRHLAHKPIVARPASALYQLAKFARRNKGLAAGLVLAFAAMFLATAISLWQLHRTRLAEGLATLRGAEAAQRAYLAALAGAGIASQSGDLIKARTLLESVPADARGWEWRHLWSGLDTSAARFECPETVLDAVLVSQDRELVAVDAGGTVHRFDAGTARPLGATSLGGALAGAAALSAGGDFVAAAAASDGRRLAVWDAASGALLAETALDDGPPRAIAISPDGLRVAVSSAKATRFWRRGDEPALSLGPTLSAAALRFTPGGEQIACMYGPSATRADYFIVLDGRTGQHGRGFGLNSMRGRAADFDPRSYRMVLGAADKQVRLHDMRADVPILALPGHTAAVGAVAFDGEGRRVASGSEDTTVRVWDAATGRLEAVLTGHEGPVSAVRFGADPARVLAASGRELRIWDTSHAGGEAYVLGGHASFVYAVAFCDGGRRLMSGAWDGTLRVWDAESGLCTAVIPVETKVHSIAAAAGVPDGAAVVAVADSSGVVLRDAGGGRAGVLGEGDAALDMAMSADGARLATRTFAEVALWDTAGGEAVARWPLRSLSHYAAVALHPGGSLIAADGPGAAITIFDAGTGETVRRLRGHGEAVFALDWSPDGTVLASGAGDDRICLWDAASGALLATLTGHTGSVYALAFSPDGARLASGSDDTSLRIWDPATRSEVAQLAGHLNYVYDLAWSPDGRTLASASGDATVRLWDTRPAHLRHQLRAAGR